MHCVSNTSSTDLTALLSRYQMQLVQVADHTDVPHSFWGAPEAGRAGSTLYVRADTPVHSLLHEACHYICMPSAQRRQAEVDAKGSVLEENACCYLQIILADYIPGLNRHILMYDMNCWGYSFRLGSTARWFFADCEETRQWLIAHNILKHNNTPSWRLR